MDPWIGPAIIAAIVSGVISVAGWFVNSWQVRRLEQLRRDEKVHDFQVALEAEIRSDYVAMSVIDRAAHLQDVAAHYAEDRTYSIAVPHIASNVVFAAVVGEIHVLPGSVIAPVVDYARLRQTVEQFVIDLRSDKFTALPQARQLAMYSDYLKMLDRLEILAEQAIAALSRSLLSSPDAGQSNQLSAAAPAGEQALASGGALDQP